MKKVRKGKKMLITFMVAVVVIIIAIIIIVNVTKNKKNNKPSDEVAQEQVTELPETTTEAGLEAQNISMEYLADNDQTMITMRVINNTSAKVPDEEFNAILIDGDDNVLGQLRTGTNTDLDVGEECEISVIYRGDMRATKRVKLDAISESQDSQQDGKQ